MQVSPQPVLLLSLQETEITNRETRTEGRRREDTRSNEDCLMTEIGAMCLRAKELPGWLVTPEAEKGTERTSSPGARHCRRDTLISDFRRPEPEQRFLLFCATCFVVLIQRSSETHSASLP